MSRRDNARNRFGIPGPRTRQSRNGNLDRLRQRPRILIVCEGTKTEPNYFKSFRVTNDVHGEGVETIRVVEEAERLYDADGPFDQTWCVFDRDSFPPDDYDNAIHKVQSLEGKGFRTAYSNESFELWYLLHFECLESAVHRTYYIRRLTEVIGKKYCKGDAGMLALLQEHGNEEQAGRYAKRLREMHDASTPHAKRCPETTVDLLVQELRRIQNEPRY